MPILDPTGFLLFLPTLGPMELIVILIIVILIFGVNKIPQLGKGLGEGIRNFKKAFRADTEEKEKSQKSEKEQEQKS